METMMVYFSSCLCLILLSVFIKFVYKFWCAPILIQSKMKSQGIKGSSYRFIYGSTKEIIQMRNEILSRPMESSNHDIFPRIYPHVYSWIKLYGQNFIFWFGTKAQLVVTEPELIKEILNNKDGTYPKKQFIDTLKKVFGDGILTASGEKWRKHRKLANQAFHPENLKNMIQGMIGSVDLMLERWREYEGKEIEVYNEFKVLTSEIISRTAFGSSYLEGENIFNMLTEMAFICFRNSFKIRIPGLGKILKTHDDIKSDKLQQGIRDSLIKLIKKRENKVKIGETDNYGSDFLGILIKASHNVDETMKISIDDVIDECKTFYLAGQETTASLLSWTVLLLATHTDWQDKARKEVLDLFGQQNPSLDTISRLKIMSMIINESLRLYPPAAEFLREVKREVKLGKLKVPANMEVSIPILALHHNPQIWGDDVQLFKPERFAEGVAKATKNNLAAFIPFGLGPRTCVGIHFANIETKIALSMILQRYKFTLSPNYVHCPIQIISICPQQGLQIMLHAM